MGLPIDRPGAVAAQRPFLYQPSLFFERASGRPNSSHLRKSTSQEEQKIRVRIDVENVYAVSAKPTPTRSSASRRSGAKPRLLSV